ncbi:toprim domain-containing protein [Fibrella forsythiae]|uniref:Toprim domain-containing protein n=1 Tax=Fibrella forsythiae TaxID=2817061 RepID=A0ABS3JKS1_9BACT|nr:toprim domain-containing protein [Fibrella forsythiae]MBO0950604.1 toprim domain-containing protein [Fibrella forsythiae]
MDIAHANTIPIAQILSQLDIHPKRSTPHRLLYLSPVRLEKTPSFWVYLKTNRWHDYGDGRGGDPVDLVCAYLKFCREAHTVSDALRWINNMGVAPYQFKPPVFEHEEPDAPSLVLKSRKTIQHLGLIHYLEKRGIPLEIAHRHLKEIHVRNQNTQKSFFALGFSNEEGGYELRNPFFKGSLGAKSISFIRGTEPKPVGIHLFEGFMDYLSAITQLNGKGFKGDAIVTNSLSCLKQAIPYIQDYGYRTAYTWLDNDPAGQKAAVALDEFFKTQADLTHTPMNKIYAPHKDVNAWHMHQRNLTL